MVCGGWVYCGNYYDWQGAFGNWHETLENMQLDPLKISSFMMNSHKSPGHMLCENFKNLNIFFVQKIDQIWNNLIVLFLWNGFFWRFIFYAELVWIFWNKSICVFFINIFFIVRVEKNQHDCVEERLLNCVTWQSHKTLGFPHNAWLG